MANMLGDMPRLTDLDMINIGCWLHGPGGKTPSWTEVAVSDKEKLKQAAQNYFKTWFISYGKSPSSSSTSCTYDKLFG
jgi:hypothetical protein